MKNGILLFPVVPHEYRSFSHHIELGPFPSDFVFSSVLGPFLRADEELGCSGELVDLFLSKVVNLTHVIFQVQDDTTYPFGINEPPNVIDLFIVLFS